MSGDQRMNALLLLESSGSYKLGVFKDADLDMVLASSILTFLTVLADNESSFLCGTSPYCNVVIIKSWLLQKLV